MRALTLALESRSLWVLGSVLQRGNSGGAQSENLASVSGLVVVPPPASVSGRAAASVAATVAAATSAAVVEIVFIVDVLPASVVLSPTPTTPAVVVGLPVDGLASDAASVAAGVEVAAEEDFVVDDGTAVDVPEDVSVPVVGSVWLIAGTSWLTTGCG